MKELFKNGHYNEKNEVLRGDLLIAEPLMSDPNFGRSVVIMCEHQNEGSFGLVLNKPSEISVEDVTGHFTLDSTVYIGGPVEQNTLHFLHTIEDLKDAVPLRDGVYWGGDYEQLKQLNDLGLVNNGNCRFFVGYSGWGTEQLKNELSQDSWVISRINLHGIFEIGPEELWKEILRSMGEKYRTLSNYPIDPRLN